MGEAPARGTESARCSRYVETPLEPTAEPIPALVGMLGDQVYALLRATGELRPLPDMGRYSAAATGVLTQGGSAAFVERWVLSPSPSPSTRGRWSNRGIYRVRFADLAVERVPFEPRAGDRATYFGASPSGERLAVAEFWIEDHPTGASAATPEARAMREAAGRLRVTRVDLAGPVSTAHVTIIGGVAGRVDDLPLQWSPDGKVLAVSVRRFVGLESPPENRLLLFDTETMTEIGSVDGAHLAGSLSWSPDGTRLLIERGFQLAIHLLDSGVDSPLPVVARERPDPPGSGRHRAVGFADDDRIFTVTERGRTMTLWRMRLDTGAAEAVDRWSGYQGQYPKLAAMPPEYWDSPPGA